MATETVLGWRSPYDEAEYPKGDPALVGAGMPPRCPNFCKDHPGAGHMYMERAMIEVPVRDWSVPDEAPTDEAPTDEAPTDETPTTDEATS